MSLEENIRQIVIDEISKRQPEDLVSVSEFCRQKKISRITLWRAEKSGRIKLSRIGKRIFINLHQFATA